MSFKKYKIKKTKDGSFFDSTLDNIKEKYINAKKRNFVSSVFLGLFGIGVIAVLATFTFSKLGNFKMDLSFLNLLNVNSLENIDPQKEKINILLTGIGGGSHEGTDLTDTIILASLNIKKKTVTMLSIPRDLYVAYPSGGAGRINELYSKGKKTFSQNKSMQYLEDKVEEITGEKTDYYLNIDFAGFIKFVDLLGGIKIDVPEDLVDTEYPDENWGYETFKIKKGLQVLDGKTALKYARSRHSTNDFDRSLRQQLVIKAIKSKLLDLNYITNPSKLQALFYAVSSNIKTDMSLKELLAIALFGKSIPNNNIFSFNLNTSCDGGENMCELGGFLYTPPRELFGGASVILPDTATPKNISSYTSINKFANIIFNYPELFSSKYEINIVNTIKVSGLANTFAVMLKKYGFNIPDQKSILSSKDNLEKTQIYYLYDNQTKTGISPDSEILSALNQFFFVDSTQEKKLKYATNPGTKIEIVLGKDYKLFLDN